VCVVLFYQPEGEEDGCAANGGALDPQPPRATGVGPEFHGLCPFPGGLFRAGFFFPFFFFCF